MSIISAVSIFALANSQALNEILSVCEGLDDLRSLDKWELWSYGASLHRDFSRPDHVFQNRWSLFSSKVARDNSIDLIALLRSESDEYLEISNGRLYIKDDSRDIGLATQLGVESPSWKCQNFGRWQNIRTRISTLPIKVLKMHEGKRPLEFFLAHPNFPPLSDFINREGLNETHLHLYAYQYPEECWLFDLYHINGFLKSETKDFKKKKCKVLYTAINPYLTPHRLANRLRLARLLRECILELEISWQQNRNDFQHRDNIIHQIQDEISRLSLSPNVYLKSTPYTSTFNSLAQTLREEQKMWETAFDLLSEDSAFEQKSALNDFLYLYLLIQNEHIQFNRHNETAFGFSAFERVSAHNRQGVGSKEYLSTTFYRILKSSKAGENNCIEVRISPQTLKNRNNIIACWEKACRTIKEEREGASIRGSRPFSPPLLILVIHLIKQKTGIKGSYKMPQPVLYKDLRRRYLDDVTAILPDVLWLIEHEQITVGLDAAACELDTPAEAFAPAYRRFEELTGIRYKTYHCGEDFRHLIGGIRAVYEAVVFLDLKNGNRIGHATAIGIPPDLWIESMPAKLVLTKQEWFLNLLFVWIELHSTQPVGFERLEKDLALLSLNLFEDFDEALPHLHELIPFFELRQLMPEYVHKYLNSEKIALTLPQEMNLVEEFAAKHGSYILKLYQHWNESPLCRKRQEELIEVPSDYLAAELLTVLQQSVQQLVSRREIIIETLPVSNLRISQYTDIQQHHILRWLMVPGYCKEGDVPLKVCLGSDDPGIFVTDIKNEYYHLYTMLCNAGLTSSESLEKIKIINDTGRIYAFRELPFWDKDAENFATMLRAEKPKMSLLKELKTAAQK